MYKERVLIEKRRVEHLTLVRFSIPCARRFMGDEREFRCQNTEIASELLREREFRVLEHRNHYGNAAGTRLESTR